MSCGVKMNYSKPSVIWVHRIRPRLYLGVFKNVIFSKKVKKRRAPPKVIQIARAMPLSSAQAAYCTTKVKRLSTLRTTTQEAPRPPLFTFTMAQFVAFVCVPYLLQALLCLCVIDFTTS